MEYLEMIILGGFFIGLLIMIRNFLSELPQRLHDIKLEGIKNKNAEQLQIDSFYRQTSNKELMKTLESWIEIIYDMNKFSVNKSDYFIKMLSNVVLYGSGKSLTKMADFQQYIYRRETASFNHFTKEEKGLIGMYLASFVITQLKEDFTGYEIDSEQLLRSKITDYNEKKELLAKCKKEAMKQSSFDTGT